MKFLLLATAFTTQTPQQRSEQATIHEINAPICQSARDTIFEGYDFSGTFASPKNKEIISAAVRFKAADCYQSPFIPKIDQQLVKKEATSIINSFEKNSGTTKS